MSQKTSTRTAARAAHPRREPGTARKAEIRTQAAEVFGRLGYAHATMRDVADATGILAGSLYHHFASKEVLLLEIMERFNADTLQDMHGALDGEADPVRRITVLIQLALRYIMERSDEARILSNDAHYIDQAPALRSISAGMHEAEALWIAELERGVEEGALRPDLEPKMAYATIMGAVFSSLRWYRPGGSVGPGEFAEQVCAQLLRGILADQ